MLHTRWSLGLLALLAAACAAPPVVAPPADPAPPARDAGPTYRLQAVGPLHIAAVSVDSALTSNPKERLIDGDQATSWVNGGYQAASAWAQADLGTVVGLASVAIKTGTSPAGTSYDLQVASTAGAWTTVLAHQTNTTWGIETKTLPAGTSGRFVRVLWHNSTTSPQPHFAIYELGVNGGGGATPAPSSAPSSAPSPMPTASAGTGTGAAAAAAAYAAHPSFLGSGMSGPNGLAIKPDDTLYEADYFRGTVTRVTQTGAVSTYASGFHGPAGLAFDAAGNLLVAAYAGNTLERIPPGGGSHSAYVSTGLNHPVWPDVDSHGTIFLADYSNNRIARIVPGSSGPVVSTFKTMSSVNAIAIDPQDNLWVCTWGGTVAKITPSGTTTTITTGLSTACGIAWCGSYLAVCTYGGERTRSGRLLIVDFAGKTYQVATGLDRASSVIFDSHLAVYAANCGDTALRRWSLK